MKYNIILAAALTLCVSSCDDFLDIQSQTNLTTATYFKTQGDFEKAVTGIYAPLRGLFNSGANGGTGSWLMGEMHSDNSRYRYNPSFRATIDPEQIADFIYLPSNGAPTNKYQGYYSVIARANQVLALIDGVEFDAAVKANLKGQALFLRALSYFDLVQYFGKLPLHLVPSTGLSDVALELSEVSAIYVQIVKDATEAANLLPLKSAATPGRATSGAAKTLLGNVHVVLKNWPAAETVLKDVVTSNQYQLVSTFSAVFNPNNKNNTESVFEVQFLQGAGGFQSNFGYTFLPVPATAAELTTIFTNLGLNPLPTSIQAITGAEGFNMPSPELIAAYAPGDLRRDATIAYGTAGGTSYPFTRKYLYAHALAGNLNSNWPIYRYAETLLLLAEALNEQGKTAEALTYLNQVHAHARTGLTPVVAASQAALQDIILNERRVELAFENKRWLDLVRTGRAVQVITAYGASIKASPQNYYFPAGQGAVPAAFTDIKLTFDLPAAESLLSPFF